MATEKMYNKLNLALLESAKLSSMMTVSFSFAASNK